MKKGLLGSTALIGVTVFMAGTAGAAEAPTWKLTGNANFQLYNVDADAGGARGMMFSTSATIPVNTLAGYAGSVFNLAAVSQDHGWYFGVDESELQLNVSGTADNGLNYGFKIEIQANTDDNTVADEARLQLSGGWGTLEMGDEDGAEDVMNYGGESLMGATGGFDGDFDDVLIRVSGPANLFDSISGVTYAGYAYSVSAPSYPTIAGDTGDLTKISYFSPRFSGFQVGASLTPTPNNGDDFKADGVIPNEWENHIGLGANYDNSFDGVRVRASAVYSMASSTVTWLEDVSAWSVGGIVGFGPVSVGANYTDNGDSGEDAGSGIESSYWNVAASFETGPMAFSAGYMSSARSFGGRFDDSTFEVIALTADYTVAPGLSAYAEIDMISDELIGGGGALASAIPAGLSLGNDTTLFIMGVNVSF